MPRRITIDPMPFLNKTFGKGLIKDLNDTDAYTEEICSYCEGTGMQIEDNPYGLSTDKQPGNLFPYKRQVLTSCRECSGTGVRKRCNYCGELLPRYSLKCNCTTQKIQDEIEKKMKWNEKVNSLRVATDEEISECKCFYSEFFPYNDGYFQDFEEFFDWWNDNGGDYVFRPQYCFGTDVIPFKIDAKEIVERACEDLYEDAYDYVSNIDELQKLIDEWEIKNSPGDTYTYHTRFKIKIPWEKACEVQT